MSHNKKGPELVWVDIGNNSHGYAFVEQFAWGSAYAESYTRSDLYDTLKAKVMALECRCYYGCTKQEMSDVCKLKAEISECTT